MRQIWIITRKELNSYFDSLMAYILIVAFLGFSGFFTWLFSDSNIFAANQASLQTFFGIAYWTLFFFAPAITMGLIAEENRSGTIELLVTKPVRDWDIVMGKFLAAFLLICITLALTLPYYITLWKLGPVDHGSVWSGYLGLLLMSATYISIGIFASSISNNQIVSFLLALCIGVFFHFIFGLLAGASTGFISGILHYLSEMSHFESISRGVIDTKDLIYFASIIFMSLTGSEVILAKRNLAS